MQSAPFVHKQQAEVLAPAFVEKEEPNAGADRSARLANELRLWPRRLLRGRRTFGSGRLGG